MKIDDFEWYDFEEVGSTNDEIKKFSTPVIVSAKRQAKGRGRRGNVWESSDGNLFFSIGITWEKGINEMPFLVSLSLIQAVLSLCPSLEGRIKLKWPNDVQIDNRKLSGILLEKAENNLLIIGIGVNIQSFPLTYQAISLKDVDIEINRTDFLKLFIKHFNVALLRDFPSIREEWLVHARGIGEEITVNFENSSLTGIFKGLSEDGALELETETGGQIKKIYAGEVFYRCSPSQEQ